MTDKVALDALCVNTIRFLAVDAVERANSGHPGAPMGLAPPAYVLFDRFLKHNPADPGWPDRDRFVLSAGHASMLLYSLLYLTGYGLEIEDLKSFRQWGSRTPGHPERGHAPGIETTTGPLGQGLGNAVGMAMAEKHLAGVFNTPDGGIVDHHTYCICSDGDLMEGVGGEAASLAGAVGLGKLIALYDHNGITIEGSTDLTFTEDVGRRFEAYGWHVVGPVDGFDLDAVEAAIAEARADTERPSLIICRTVIGYGSPKQNTAAAHGSPLGSDAARAAKAELGWPLEPEFFVPEEVLARMRGALDRGAAVEAEWRERFETYRRAAPERAAEFERRTAGSLPEAWDRALDALAFEDGTATRVASGKALNAIAERVPDLIGGSADLAPSNKTMIEGAADFAAGRPAGRNVHFGVREHAMGAALNGLAIHGGVIPYGGTFLVFSDYMRPSIRLAAMMGLRVIYVFTHDSIGVGEDGPTHQPVEHVMSLRVIPNLTVIRPSDANETVDAWRSALTNTSGPTALVLTRQRLPIFARPASGPGSGALSGGYVLWQAGNETPEVILIGTGSEVEIALEAGRVLAEDGYAARVVSLPSWELFDSQAQEYRDAVLPPDVTARVAVEAGVRAGWEHYVGLSGEVVGMNGFGASAPYRTNYERFGITAEAVAEAARRVLGREA